MGIGTIECMDIKQWKKFFSNENWKLREFLKRKRDNQQKEGTDQGNHFRCCGRINLKILLHFLLRQIQIVVSFKPLKEAVMPVP